MGNRNRDERSEVEKAQHAEKIAAWYRRKDGKTQTQIAQELGISQATVSREIQRLKSKAQREAVKEMKTALGETNEQLQWVIEQGMKAWEESKQSQTRITRLKPKKNTSGHPHGGVPTDGNERESSSELITTSSAGEPRFLDIVGKTAMDRAKLLGVVDQGIKLPPETLMLIAALGLDIKDVAKALTVQIKAMAAESGIDNPTP